MLKQFLVFFDRKKPAQAAFLQSEQFIKPVISAQVLDSVN